jgi:hypothetical protein
MSHIERSNKEERVVSCSKLMKNKKKEIIKNKQRLQLQEQLICGESKLKKKGRVKE